MAELMHQVSPTLLVMVGMAVASCAPLPDLPTDPADRCEALGGIAMTFPPTVDSEGKVSPGKFDHCYQNVHASEEDVRRARRAWHERNKASTAPASPPSR